MVPYLHLLISTELIHAQTTAPCLILALFPYTRRSVFEHTIYHVSVCCSFENIIIISSSSSRKAIPLQAWTGPEGSRRLRLPNFKTVGT